MDHIHDHLFAFRIDVGSRLVKDIDRRIVEKSPGNSKSLTLTTGEVSSFLHDRCSGSLLCLQEAPQIHLLKSFPHLSFRCVRFSHPQVICHSSFEEIAVMTDHGDLIHKAVFLYF